MRSCVSVRARSCVHVCPFVCTKGKGMWARCACARVCKTRRMKQFPVQYLEVQRDGIAAVSLARGGGGVLRLGVIFVVVSVLFKTAGEGLVSKGC